MPLVRPLARFMVFGVNSENKIVIAKDLPVAVILFDLSVDFYNKFMRYVKVKKWLRKPRFFDFQFFI